MGIARLFTDTVPVEPYLGSRAGSPAYGPAQSVSCFVNDSRKVVRNSDGAEVVSETTLYAALAAASAFPVGSRVTVNERSAFVINVYRRDSAGPASAHHLQVELT